MNDPVHVWFKIIGKGLELEAVVTEDKSLDLSERVKMLFMSGADNIWLPHEKELTGLYS
ncbi:MAG: hypothetical protein V1743_07715 [Nanoarchaeota archaeon]